MPPYKYPNWSFILLLIIAVVVVIALFVGWDLDV